MPLLLSRLNVSLFTFAKLVFITLTLVVLISVTHETYQSLSRGPVPRVAWLHDTIFVLDRTISDDFNGHSLDESKWDTHGQRNPDTGCPKWNGPPSSSAPDYATLFATPTDPVTGLETYNNYAVRNWFLEMRMREEDEQFFESREYYCNSTTFKCNHDESIDCFATDLYGRPRYRDKHHTQYVGVVHDKCKKSPFCIAHPEIVRQEPRIYTRYTGMHLASKRASKYGFYEARVRLPESPMVTAIWMHNNEMVDGYCRYRFSGIEGDAKVRLECPSITRSRRWQELDMLEAMNFGTQRKKYVPNIHAFAMYKGEFSAKNASDRHGGMGGGPIIVNKEVFGQKRPDFSDLDEDMKRPNDWHYSSGAVANLTTDWAARVRTVGMYWSANEIRFYLDGKEVKRIKNSLIHEALYVDLSFGLNVEWGKQEPTKEDVEKPVKVYYFRRWDVYTREGKDPESKLEIDDKMERTFKNLYGTKMQGVLGRLPNQDNLTVYRKREEEERRTRERELELRRKEDRVNRGIGRGGRLFVHAGGWGNMGWTKERTKLNEGERIRRLAREDRISVVDAHGNIVRHADQGGWSVWDTQDPNGIGAAWASRNGDGIEIMA